MTATTPGLKLVLSKLPASAAAFSRDETPTTPTTPTTPILVLHNIGAQRCCDVVEAFTAIDHFARIAVQDGAGDNDNNFITVCPDSVKLSVGRLLGIDPSFIVHAVVNESSSPVRVIWHYGWPFSVVLPLLGGGGGGGGGGGDEVNAFCERLKKLLESFSATGRRIQRGSARPRTDGNGGGDDDSEDSSKPITTLPVHIACSVERDVPRSLVDLLIAQASSNTLFGTSRPWQFATPCPSGLFMKPNFLSAEQEQQLLKFVDSWPDSRFDRLNQRRVAHFGRAFDYASNNVFAAEQMMPALRETPWIADLLKSVHAAMAQSGDFADLKEEEWDVDQMTVSEYVAGSCIPPHLDHEVNFGEIIVAVAVGAPTVFEYVQIGGGDKQTSPQKCSVLFPPRALLVMHKEGRYGWKHAIAARSCDYMFFDEGASEAAAGGLKACSVNRGRRVSFTFRRVTAAATAALAAAAAAAAAATTETAGRR